MKKKLDWANGITYTIIDTKYNYLKNFGISDEDIKEHGNEMMQQLVALFNYMSFSNA